MMVAVTELPTRESRFHILRNEMNLGSRRFQLSLRKIFILAFLKITRYERYYCLNIYLRSLKIMKVNKDKVVPVHYAMKAYGGVDVQILIFMTSVVAGGEWSASRPCRFIPG
jgi:hypothetical protein